MSAIPNIREGPTAWKTTTSSFKVIKEIVLQINTLGSGLILCGGSTPTLIYADSLLTTARDYPQ